MGEEGAVQRISGSILTSYGRASRKLRLARDAATASGSRRPLRRAGLNGTALEQNSDQTSNAESMQGEQSGSLETVFLHPSPKANLLI